jgi:hypothetical protein
LIFSFLLAGLIATHTDYPHIASFNDTLLTWIVLIVTILKSSFLKGPSNRVYPTVTLPHFRNPDAIRPAPLTLKKDSINISTGSNISFYELDLDSSRDTNFLAISTPSPVTLEIGKMGAIASSLIKSAHY